MGGSNFGKNLVIAGALLAAGFFAAWLRFRPYLGTEGTFTDGVQTFDAAGLDRVRYAIWESPEPLPGEVNSPENERKPALTPDGRHVVFTVGERGLGLDLWIADLVDGRAIAPRPLSAVNSPSDDLAPAFSGDRLWFASNRPGSDGGLDLWTALYDRGAFGPPERVGGGLNSAADDTDPAPVPGSDVVVFASNRGKLGAYPDHDLYGARRIRTNDGALAFEVAPLAALNSPFEEREPTFTADGRAVVFSSDREGGAGGFDLYRSGLVPGASIGDLGAGFVPPEPLTGVNGPTDERGPLLSLDGFTLYFGVEAEVGGRPAADLFRAASKELFRTPGPPVGWRELLVLLALLALALLAALAKRWRAMDVLYKCVLVSLLVHLLMLWWAREVYPEHVQPGVDAEGTRTRVRLVVDPASLAAQRNQERAGEVQVARAEREEAAQPERADQALVEVERELSASATALERSERQPDADASEVPRRAAVSDAAPSARALRSEAVADARESFERLAERAPTAVEVAAGEVRAERSARAPERTEGAAPSAAALAERTASELAPTSAAPLARSARSDPGSAPAPSPVRAETFVDRGPRAASRDVSVAAPTEAVRPSESDAEGSAAGTGGFELAAADTSLARTQGGAAAPGAAPAPRPLAALGDPTSGGSAQGTLGPASLAPLARSERGAGPMAAPVPAFVAAGVEAPRREAPLGPGSALRGIELVAPSPAASAEAPATAGSAAPEVRFDPLADLAAGGPAFERQPRGAAQPTDQGPARVATPGAAAPLADSGRAPAPSTRPFEAVTRVAGEPAAPAPQRNPWDDTAYQSRSGAQKVEALDVYGGSVETERAVTRGLVYLASVQRREGNWGRSERDEKYGFPTVGKTGLALLAFMGAGHTPSSNTEHSAVVARGVQYLVGTPDPTSGHFGDSDAYSHGIATYALAECYALTKDPQLVRPLRSAVQHIIDAQYSSGDLNEDGGWGYYYPTSRVYDRWPRASVTAWQVMALESAQLGGIAVPKQVFRRAASFLANSWDPQRGAFRYSHDPQRLRSNYPTLPGSTPAAIFALSLLGADVSSADFRAARRFVMERLPQGFRFTGEDDFVHRAQANLYFWYYGTLAMFRVGGDDWKRWNVAMKETLLPAQDPDGSWKPISIYAEYAQDTDRDRVYTTALCVLTLEVYYRYFTPLLKVD